MKWFLSALAALVLVALLWWFDQQRQAGLAPEPKRPAAEQLDTPKPRYPLPEPRTASDDPAPEPSRPADTETARTEPAPEPSPETSQPLPDLTESDPAALDSLAGLIGADFVARWLKEEFVVARTVAIVNSLDQAAPGLKTWPLQPLPGEPRTQEIESGTLLWSEGNSGRYDPLMAALDAAEPAEAARLYTEYYPLFQQAWEGLGESPAFFNDRLIEIVDHLLATPAVDRPVEVEPYENRFHFADESLQEQSWGRKLMIRMGPEHERHVRSWLGDFRAALVERPGEGDEPAGNP